MFSFFSFLCLPENITFPQYTIDEVKDILSNRAKMGFYPGVIDETVLDRISEHTSALGDLRVGIDLLKRSALNAERIDADFTLNFAICG